MNGIKRISTTVFSMLLLVMSASCFNLVAMSAISIRAGGSTVAADAAACSGSSSTDQSACNACHGLGQLSGTGCAQQGATSSPGQNAIGNLANNVVNIVSLIAGMAAVIMIVVGGFRFVTSGGDSNAAASARNMIIYAIIGLAIVALAQVIVHFVLNGLNGNVVPATSSPPSS